MEYNIIVERKKMKNIIIRITKRGKIKVLAPSYTSDKEISEAVMSIKEWIDTTLEKVLNNLKENKMTFENGDIIYILGKPYKLQIVMSSQNKVELDDYNENSRYLFLYVNMNNNIDIKKDIIYDWLKKELFSILVDLNKKYGEITGFYPKEFKIRDMKSLWGSCNVRTRKITYNLHLIEKPIEAIEYVVLHEISHIPHPNHQKEFWNFVGKYMPNWKERKNMLKKND
ncbi:MAG: M48 family metallopeptidase [Fusobacteriaceae bacterium]|nr:M48 family metallopeptidase [Fusobacteriaceae bacterium]